jgi:hypothetical protein
MRLACASARSGAANCPPSEKESGVILRTPITAGQGRDKSAGHAGRSAAGAVLDEVAIMPVALRGRRRGVKMRAAARWRRRAWLPARA